MLNRTEIYKVRRETGKLDKRKYRRREGQKDEKKGYNEKWTEGQKGRKTI